MTKKMTISDFKLKTITFELRYEPAYLLWDNAGKLWQKAKEIWPEIKNRSAKPNQTSFMLGTKAIFTVELEKSFIIFYNQRIKDTIELQEKFLDIMLTHLKISSYTRIGFRVVYEKEFPDKQSATEAFLALEIIRTPKKKCFNIDGEIIHPEYTVYWENEDLGVRVNLKSVSKKIELEVPPELIDQIDSTLIEKETITFDLDYFTKASIKPGQFRLKDWVSQIEHVIRRDSIVFLGGE